MQNFEFFKDLNEEEKNYLLNNSKFVEIPKKLYTFLSR